MADARDRLKACLHPLRLRLLDAVHRVPGSGLSLAKRLGDRQPRVHYHLRCLERAGLVRVVEERRKRGVVEKLYATDPEAYASVSQALSVGEAGGFLGPLLREVSAAASRADAFLAVESRTLRLTRGQAKQLQEDLLRLLRQYQAREAREGEEHRIAWVLLPKEATPPRPGRS